ncbi:MAG: hypothetical protein EOP47_22685 [Sphingobacteriaceae bacterium]|nr:MAG: hypothetical protein EOP47_22685 [Sphingobacteriaceae bacterium]
MKKYLLILLLLSGISAGAQNVTFTDLTNLAHLGTEDSHKYLTVAHSFKRDYVQDVNGLTVGNYKCVTDSRKRETVIVGEGIKLNSGDVLRSVYYDTNIQQHIVNLIAQVKRSGLKQTFKGVDAFKNIFIFDNDLYNVVINLNIYDGAGSVKIRQKEFAGVN